MIKISSTTGAHCRKAAITILGRLALRSWTAFHWTLSYGSAMPLAVLRFLYGSWISLLRHWSILHLIPRLGWVSGGYLDCIFRQDRNCRVKGGCQPLIFDFLCVFTIRETRSNASWPGKRNRAEKNRVSGFSLFLFFNVFLLCSFYFPPAKRGSADDTPHSRYDGPSSLALTSG